MNALETHQLVKCFGGTRAVDHVALRIPAGSWYGLVGPNGAGKTTTLSMAVGLLRPDAGTASIFGVDVWSRPDEAKALVGLLPEGRALPERLTGTEVLEYLGLLRGMSSVTVAVRTAELLTVLGLQDAEATLVADYSTGMRKKLSLAAALLHGPRLLVLDEPFESVDPVAAATVRGILGRFVARGGSVVMSSHVMALVEQCCDHVAVMSAGKVVSAGPIDQVRLGGTLDEAFAQLVGTTDVSEGALSWLNA